MFAVDRKRDFSNGCVYLLRTPDGLPVETTDTFLPFYTKDAVGRKQNCLDSDALGSRAERWMIGVSTMSGCPVGCKFCATGKLKRVQKLSSEQICQQVRFARDANPSQCPYSSREFKINYTRMGEPFLNIAAVREAISEITRIYSKAHHYVSTIGIQGSDFSWIRGNVTLQISLHSLDEARRDELIPFKRKMSIEELGQIRTNSNLKTTVNLTLVDEADFDIEKLRRLFDPEHFFVKLSPINPNDVSAGNDLGDGIITGKNLR